MIKSETINSDTKLSGKENPGSNDLIQRKAGTQKSFLLYFKTNYNVRVEKESPSNF